MGLEYGTYVGEERCIQGLVGKPEGKRPLDGLRCGWEDNIKMISRNWDGGEAWTGLIWLRIGTGGGLL